MRRLIGSMEAFSAYRGRILLAMIFLASPRMDLCMYLCSWLLELSSGVQFSNRSVEECQMVTASHEAILVYYKRYE
jgi:hypothetical protein